MNPIKDFAQMTAYLQSYSERKRVVVVCPNDPHTEYAVLRALKERLAEFVLITDSHYAARVEDIRNQYPQDVEMFVVPTPDDAAALAVAQNPGISYNPLFIYGSTGLGKTHLMHAIAQFVLKNRHDARIVYLSSETFVNEYVDALRENKITNFRKRYRNTDVLLIDDVQFFAGKERCQEEFFHTFNELFNSSKQIVLSCDKPINEVSDIEQRLVSRFGWGVSVDIQAPDYETRLAILQSKLADIPKSVEIQPEVLDLLARKFTKNIRRMEGALNNLIGYATLLKTISLEKAQQLQQNREKRSLPLPFFGGNQVYS